MKGKGWPKLYHAKIAVFDLEKQQEVKEWIPFLLPREVVRALFARGDFAKLLAQECLPKDCKAHLAKHCAALGCSADQIFPVGLWSDGVPCNWDRSQSIEVLCSTSRPSLTTTTDAESPHFVARRTFMKGQKTWVM